MITQKDKTSTRLLRKRGTTSNVMKSRPLSDGEFLDGEIKPENETLNEISTSFSTLDPASGNYYEKCWTENGHLETTPRDVAKGTSKGVHDFIKQVSNAIENENPFEDTVRYSFGRPEQNVNPTVFDADEFSNTEILSHKILRKEYGTKNTDVEKSIRRYSDLKLPSKKNLEKGSSSKKTRSGSISKKRDHSAKRNQKDSLSNLKKLAEPKSSKISNDFYNEKKNIKTSCSQEVTDKPTSKSNSGRRRKRSEIPLRKNRTDASKRPKPLSFLMRNPLKQAESSFSVDLGTKKKSFSPIEELSLCSELQITINAVGSSENFNLDSGRASDTEYLKKNTFILENVKLDRCLKSPNIPDICDSDGQNELKKNSSKETKISGVDLDKMKTSSFTVFRTNTTVLDRLESLHKRNVSTKENPSYGKKSSVNSSRGNVVTSKPSFSSLKGKGSKKHLSSRLSSKGNKPGLKAKSRKIKKEEENLRVPKINSLDETQTNFDICKHLLTGNYENQKNETLKKESVINTKSNKRGVKLTPKSPRSPRSLVSSKFKEESKGSPRGKQKAGKTEVEDSKKLTRMKSFRNPSDIKKAFLQNIASGEKALASDQGVPITPPPTPVASQSISMVNEGDTKQDDKTSKKTHLKERISSKHTNDQGGRNDQNKKEKSKTEDMKKMENSDLVVRGTSLNCKKDEPPEKPKSLESLKLKKQLDIDLNCQKNDKNPESLDWLYMKSKKYEGEVDTHSPNSKNLESEETKSEINKNSQYMSAESFSSDLTDEPPTSDQQKTRNSSAVRKLSDENVKGLKKKKVRSDAGDRQLPSSSYFKSHVSIQNKIKVDTKLRSSLTKSSNREEKRDLFEDAAAVKLKRRNSEPHTLREYVWKPPDITITRSHKPSVSSMASSLRHLNTDEIDDFIFWEPVPQKISSCWETSLYRFKRAWTVLSCSVFRDNRKSNTPGLILENLRNRENLTTRPSKGSQNEVSVYHKKYLFDVEPSIAQKNIDIRNWLAALNFPTPPSTSNDITEGNFSTPSLADSQNMKKSQVNTKRRKVLPILKFYNESAGKTPEEKFKTSADWNGKETDGLMELIQRKSGGFVTKEEYMNSENSISKPKVNINLNAYSTLVEEKPIGMDNSDTNNELQGFEISKSSIQTDESVLERIDQTISNQLTDNSSLREKLPEGETKEKKFKLERLLRGNLSPLFSEVNVWKYLFLFTLIIAILHFCFLSSSLCRNQ